ncbi:dimethylsulfoniopropionate lyase [Rhizobium sp. TRM95796]|uniref:dimethylsulfoniopropionate lyase n=1 Tax=Rhizobium sp. TRM95796 TaxID=2979862 RepID=UPI0021E87930|nr:dimethylsulfoniopropionate lyase [Rhizobium sp. TRM95796]MCV3766077.1 dimethylsulfoniopropionate lyase [Rhizobium sp. TRM95796]
MSKAVSLESALQEFLDALRESLLAVLPAAGPSRAAFERLEKNMADRAGVSDRPHQSAPACRHLADSYAALEGANPLLTRLTRAIEAIEPSLRWSNAIAPGQPPLLEETYAEAMIVGAGGLAESKSVEIGLSILAPNTDYPDHRHPPEELYIALSEGDWRQNADPWVTPGKGGLIYNPIGITHAMRSGDKPLFAIWSLPLP